MDPVRTNVLDITGVDATQAAQIRAEMDNGTTLAYIVHLSEGIDEASRGEFDYVWSRNLLTDKLVVIHGTAFGQCEFQQMGMAGTKLVWSPRSNVILYGRTTDIPTALMNNVSVSLAPDWTPSGGPDLFAEMRYARYVSNTLWNGRLTNRDLFEMTTIRPARATARGSFVGSLEVGKFADIMVLPDRGCDAYDTFVNGVPSELTMVMIGGKPLYGDAAVMNALPATLQANCEDFTACTVAKRVCVSKGAGTPNENGVTLAQITAEMNALTLPTGYPYTVPYPLVPLCP
jgi:cytosine/adenosine deaminase-related metal-dependent hydrolase